MHRKATTILWVALVLISLPAGAAAPFGSFGGIAGGGTGGAGNIPIHGWALDDDGVAAVDILVDGVVVGRAQYGRTRPGVTQLFPGFPDSEAPGFAFQLDSTRYLNGLHQVSARVLTNTGELRTLSPITLQFTNLSHNLVPFGRVEFPNSDAELFGRCNLAEARRYSVITGYALDVGVETHDQGVAYVELLIDGALHRNTLDSCHFDANKGGLSDCYGFRRFDIPQLFPNISDGPHSGFRFVLDIGALLNSGYVQGRHLISIRSGDQSGQVAMIHEFPVTFTCDDILVNEGSWGEVRRPRGGLTYFDTVEANGWALDREGVAAVLIHVDGIYVGDAEYGLPRPGVTQLYPGFFNSPAPGWRFLLDTTALSDGDHTFQVLVRDLGGQITMIGERRFTVFNP
jgi:hypothetical protein